MSSAIPDLLNTDTGSGHTRWVRISHWIVATSVLTLALTGFVILMAHPRLYWGAVGNDLTPALLELPISRNHKHGGWEKSVAFFPDAGSPVTAARTYDILNENSWGRSLHFLAAWFLDRYAHEDRWADLRLKVAELESDFIFTRSNVAILGLALEVEQLSSAPQRIHTFVEAVDRLERPDRLWPFATHGGAAGWL